MKIFITGNLGFIGSYLSEELIMENHSLIGYDIQEHKGNVGYPSAQGDVRDVLRLQQSIPHDTELIIHLAAEHKDFGVSEDEYFDVNERGTQYLLECATKYNINKFIFYSSVAIYGNQKFTTEETVPEPGNPYGASKLAAENLISKWARKNRNREVAIIRPTVVFGPNNFANIYKLVSKVCDHRFIWVGDGNNVKSVAYVENLVSANLFIMDKLKPGVSVFNYVDEPQMSTKQIVNLITEIAGVTVPKVRIPISYALGITKFIELLAVISGQDFAITSSRIKKFTTTTYHYADKIRDVGFRPKFTLKEGMRTYVQWYLEEGRFLKEIASRSGSYD